MLTANPLCSRTGHEWWWPDPPAQCVELATDDDHVVPIADGGDLDDPANRAGLCGECHKVKSSAEAARRRL